MRLEAAPVVALAFTPDGKHLVSNGPRCLIVRSPADGAEQARIPCDLQKITALSFHGSLLALAGGTPRVSGAVWLVDWKSREVIHRWSGLGDLATSLEVSPDGTRIVVGSSDETARILELSAPLALREVVALRGHAAPVLAAAFLPHGKTIVTTSADRSMKVWDGGDGRLIRTFTQHTDAIHALAVRPSNAEIPIAVATVSDDRTLRIWQPEIGRMVRIVRGHDAAPFAVAYARDGASLFTAGREGVIRRVEAESDIVLDAWPAHDDAIYSLAVSPDGSALASGDWQGRVRIWKIKAIPAEPAAPSNHR